MLWHDPRRGSVTASISGDISSQQDLGVKAAIPVFGAVVLVFCVHKNNMINCGLMYPLH